jgi:hypothetical protein
MTMAAEEDLLAVDESKAAENGLEIDALAGSPDLGEDDRDRRKSGDRKADGDDQIDPHADERDQHAADSRAEHEAGLEHGR